MILTVFFGRTGRRSHPDTVQTASVVVSDHERCEALWNITGGQICAAGQPESGQRSDNSQKKQTVADSCNGDSGGGLTSTNSRGKQARRL